jgi:tetratricopeptide (TPR) repeat protein
MFRFFQKSLQIIKRSFFQREDRTHEHELSPNRRDHQEGTGAPRQESTTQDANFKNRDINPIFFSPEIPNDKSAGLKTTEQKSSKEYFAKGNSLFFNKGYLEALKAYDKAIELNPNAQIPYLNRGLIKHELGLKQEALIDYELAKETDPTNSYGYYNAGILKTEFDDLIGSIEDYSKSIYLNPTFSDAYNNRAYARIKFGSYEAAIEDCNKAIELNSLSPFAYNNRGFAKYKLGKFEEALQDSLHSKSLDDTNSYVYYYLGLIYHKLGNTAQSTFHLEKADALGYEDDREEIL